MVKKASKKNVGGSAANKKHARDLVSTRLKLIAKKKARQETRKRGAAEVVKVKTTYAAGVEYTHTDVVTLDHMLIRVCVLAHRQCEPYKDKEVHNPELERVKELHRQRGSKLDLKLHKGNWDEWQLDLNSFATSGKGFLVLRGKKCNIVIPFKRCPHITVVSGFMELKPLMTFMLLPRKDNIPPEFAQHLTWEWVVGIIGTEAGWICYESNRSCSAFSSGRKTLPV
ncbi:hypothetical protein CYMTET_5469 [Cymbomonas tetramitiformis]|uniref:Uncharacterized protein n=1 Tax=Cymbomonas tetramitiformis TaxID=36881 RepID=A0AAE0LJ15_9CHLO|nr:hypothetical protein CYMTET_5469 [Cymbomonas tetramitiformis]